MKINKINYVEIKVKNLIKSARFYHEVLDMPIIQEKSNNNILVFQCGHQTIHLRQIEQYDNKIDQIKLCLNSTENFNDIINHLKSYFVKIVSIKQKVKNQNSEITILDNDQNTIVIYTNKK